MPLPACDFKVSRVSVQRYLITAGLAVFFYLLHATNLINFHELNAVDLRLKLRGEKKADPRIVIVEIDDASLKAVGQWPWPRGIDGALLTAISQFQPRFIFLDLLYTEPSPDPFEDKKLAFAIQKAHDIMVPFYFYSQKPLGAFFPIPSVRRAAKTIGFVNMDAERDGIVRKWLPFFKSQKGHFYPSGALAVLLSIKNLADRRAFISKLPLDPKQRLWIHYPGTIRSFKRITAWEVIDAVGKKDEELRRLFAGNFVFIGHTATATSDLKPTPFSAADPGIAIHASAFNTLLTEKFLRSAPPLADFLLLLALLLSVTKISQTGSPQKSLLLISSLGLVYIGFNFFSFYAAGVIFPLYLPLVSMALLYLLMVFLKYVNIRFQGELLHRELETAARIQESFLPKSNPTIPGIDLAFECRFAKQVGGDLYDWIELKNGRVAVALGDVSGKGCPAALYMARAINELRREYKEDRLPGELNSHLNIILSKGETSGMFLTLFSAILDTERKKIFFSNAGHEPLIYYSSLSKKCEIIKHGAGAPLGLFEESPYETAELSYQPGDMIVIISDGIKELRNPRKEQFGMDRLKTVVENKAVQDLSASGMIAQIFRELDEYRKDSAPHDDRTILCARFK